MINKWPRLKENILRALSRLCLALLLYSCLISFNTVRLWAVDNVPQGSSNVENVPATYFGTVLPDSSVPGFKPDINQVVRAEINGKTCGQTNTISENAQIVYRISVVSDSEIDGSPGCGVQDATVIFFIADQLMQPMGLWSSGVIQELSLRPAPTVTPTPTLTLISPITPIVTPTIIPNKPVSIPEPVTIVLFSTGLTFLNAIKIIRGRKRG